MSRYGDLTEGQKELYDKLKTAIQKQKNIYEEISCDLSADVLEKEDWQQILTTVEPIDDQEHTLTLLGYAIDIKNQEGIRAILDVAEKDKEVLKEVFAGVEEHDRKRLTEILETLKNQEQNEEQKTKIDGWLEILAKSVSSNYKSDKQSLAPERTVLQARKDKPGLKK